MEKKSQVSKYVANSSEKFKTEIISVLLSYKKCNQPIMELYVWCLWAANNVTCMWVSIFDNSVVDIEK